MDFTEFKNSFSQLKKRAEAAKEHIQSEEATKTSIVMPFFRNLGYDVFNPQEFLPEFTADVGIKKGEKVDYAIMVDGCPVILIEAKPYKSSLEQHDSQLVRYFHASSVKFAILTNGILYRFFTDLENTNKMDEKPFFEFNLLEFRDKDLKELEKFRKEKFDVSSVIDTAEELKYKNMIKDLLKKQLDEDASDSFLSYVLNEVYPNKRKTQQVLDRFRPWLPQAFDDLINERIDERLQAALGAKEKEAAKESKLSDELTAKEETSELITITEAELGVFYTIASILREIVPISRLAHRKNNSYCNILVDDKRNNWIARIHINKNKNLLEINGCGLYEYESLNDLHQHKDKVTEALQKFM